MTRRGRYGPYSPQYAPPGTIGALIRDRRRELGLTHSELAAKVGCVQSMVSFIEAGRRAPSKDVLQRLAIALDMAVPS